MKKVLACALFVSFLTFQLAASNAHEERCRQLTSFSTLSQDIQVENDLISGVWSLRSEGQSLTFEFNTNGIASLITETTGNINYSNVLWNVATQQNLVVLSITGTTNDTKHFTVVQNCDGVLLKSLEDDKAEQWTFEKPLHKYEKQTMEMQLIGQWKAIFGSEDAIATKYDFRKNGTLSMNEAGIQTPGVWDFTEDGQYIMITLQNDAGSFIEHFALRILDMDYHSASFSLNAQGETSEVQYFEKI